MKTKKQLMKAINDCKDRIAKERDALRELLEDVGTLADDCDQALENLEQAADLISQTI